MPHPRNRIWQARAGTTTLEFALGAVVTVQLLFAGVEWGRLLWTRQAAMHAADAAARCYAISSPLCTGTNTPASYAVTVAANDGVTLSSSDLTVAAAPSCTSATGGSIGYYTVTISHAFTSPLSALLLLPSTFTVSASYGC